MEQKRKRPPYKEFMAWMLVNDISRKDLIELLNLSDSTLSHRLNGTGADFSMEEVRKILDKYGNELASFFFNANVEKR